MTSSRCSHVVLILDLCPSRAIIDCLEHWLNSVIAFANTHLLLNEKNALTVIGCHADANRVIHPNKRIQEMFPRDSQHHSFLEVTESISAGIKSMMNEWRTTLSQKHHSNLFEPLISGALSLSLCHINRRKSEFDSSRVMIITPSLDHPFFLTSQYMHFMNCFFTSQKMQVMIDVTTANTEAQDSSNSILRQACDITGGTYLCVPNQKALLQYLMWVLLPDKESRSSLVLPQKVAVGSRAACFCHRTLIDIGYVCSVCLSVFCSFSPICSTCSTIFKLGPVPIPSSKTLNKTRG